MRRRYDVLCRVGFLYNVIDFVSMYKSVVESCVDKKVLGKLSFFERCWNSLLHLLMELRRSLLRIDKASLLETFGSLKIRNFGYTPSCLQLFRKWTPNFSLFFLYSNFSYFRKTLTVVFSYFCAISLEIFITFLDSTKLKMPIISVEKMKIIDEKKKQKTTKEKQRQKGARETEAIAKL